jgi:hypothetical protein
MDDSNAWRRMLTRRHLLGGCGVGLGRIALAGLLGRSMARGASIGDQLAPRPAPSMPKVTQVIHLFMAGAPSQLDLFDHKPVLGQHAGQPIPAHIVKDQRYAFIRRDATLLEPQYAFSRHGRSGAEISAALPHLAKVADDLLIVKSMHTDQFNHAPAELFMMTGNAQPGRPSMGAWVTYGLGSETDDLPAYVVLSSGGKGSSAGAAAWSSGFLPTVHQGVPFRARGEAILNVSNPAGYDRQAQRETIDAVGALNRARLQAAGDDEIATRISAYEMAYRMQISAPELMDLSSESDSTLELYGVQPGKPGFANNCLLARRLIERGVRFVQLVDMGWDHHSQVKNGLGNKCGQTDRAVAALLMDLKARGMLERTLVIWGGEFGRTPMVEANPALGRSLGRDHHPQAFTMWMAGGGLRTGTTLGATDDLGFHITQDPVHVHDLHATLLHLLGFDHEKLSVRMQGLDFRLTGVAGKVVGKMLA